MALTDTTIPPITGIDDPAQARVLLYQAGRPVHAPMDNVGLLPITTAEDTYLPLAGGALTGGITFPATQVASVDANTLDDYEEGEWTPGISFSGASVGVTYAADNCGYYTKIGNVVTVSGVLSITSKGSSTGIALITGFPFVVPPPDGVKYQYPAVTIGFYAFFSVGYNVMALLDVNSTSAFLYQGSATTSTPLTEANCGATTYVDFSATYLTV